MDLQTCPLLRTAAFSSKGRDCCVKVRDHVEFSRLLVDKSSGAHYSEKKKRENFSHVAIYNKGKGGSLYRHFMKLANGAIIELSPNRMNMYADYKDN